MKKNIIKEKSYLFAVRIVKLCKLLNSKNREFILSGQVLRSGTSIGALTREAEHAESKADFIHKFSIALKEANETQYWIELLKDTEYINDKEFNSLNSDLKSIIALLTSIIKTTKGKIYKKE